MSTCVKLTMLCIEQSIMISPQIVLVEMERFLIQRLNAVT